MANDTSDDARTPERDPVRRAIARSLAVTAALLVAAGALAAQAGGRIAGADSIRHGGVRENGVVLGSWGGTPLGRALVQYDVDRGGLQRTAVPVSSVRGYSAGRVVRVAYERADPSRARILGTRDPIPPLQIAVAAGLALLAAFAAARALIFRRRIRRAAASEESSTMRAALWRSRDGRRWMRLDIAAAPEAPAWWVPIASGQSAPGLAEGETASVRGSLADGWALLDVAGTRIVPGGRATTRAPRGATRVPDGGPVTAVSGKRGAVVPTVVGAALVAAILVIDGPVQAPFLAARERRDAPVCASLDRRFARRSSAVDTNAPATVDQLAMLSLPKALVSTPPRGIGFDDVPVVADSFMTVSQAAQTRRDAAEGARVLRRYGYVGGYRRDWASGGRILTVFAYQFASARDADAFDVYANESACPYALQSFMFADLAGATGLRVRTSDGGDAEQVSFVRGTRRFLAGITFGGPLPGHDDVHTLARAEAAIAGG